jgi:hypothetical protein
MPELTVIDRVSVDVDRITKYGSEATLILYNEDGSELVRLEKNWFIYKNGKYARNAMAYNLKIVEEQDALLDVFMQDVKSFRYFLNADDTKLSQRYLHNGIDAPDLGDNRTWEIGVNKEKFRNTVFQGE